MQSRNIAFLQKKRKTLEVNISYNEFEGFATYKQNNVDILCAIRYLYYHVHNVDEQFLLRKKKRNSIGYYLDEPKRYRRTGERCN